MADKRDYYEVLGISKDADDSQIKKAYRVLAKKYHPDVNPGDKEAEAKFKEASEAYAILSDPEKRKQYDQYGHAAFEGGAGGAGGFEFNFDDIFGGGGFGDIFSDLFGGRSSYNSNAARRGQDIIINLRLTFEEAIFGCKKQISFQYKEVCKSCNGNGAEKGSAPEKCTKCNGTGRVMMQNSSFFGMISNIATTCPVCSGKGTVIKNKCKTCRGTGYTSTKKTLEVDIPKGVNTGTRISVGRGMGEPGVNGGPRGNVYVQIIAAESREFVRDNLTLYSETPISFADATLGGDVKVKTVYGDVLYTIKPGTKTGTRVRLKGKGVSHPVRQNEVGDLITTLTISVPTSLNKKQKEALRAFDNAMKGIYDIKEKEDVESENTSSKTEKSEKSSKKKNFFKK